ncbi:MAG: hypothetical protein EOM26_10590 [Alphaproteobacteria bacterium]|nr:hypothetical protein [Alphaproteobacteria bacterium]
MSVTTDTLLRLCNAINSQISETHKSLKLHCIAYHSGQRAEAIALDEHDILRHPAGQYARSILRRRVEDDSSAFLGLASATERLWFGLSSRSHLLALLTANADIYEDAKQARQHLYHLVWHALDLCEIRERPIYREKFRNGPMIPKRSPMNQARANLRADVFSAAMMAMQGEKDAIAKLARERSLRALTPNAGYRAEDYPYIIAMEAAQFAYRAASKNPSAKVRMVHTALQISEEVGQTFEEASIRQWWAFSQPAQDMAWRGYRMEEILGAAVNTSDDPYVRATGLLIYEVTGVMPSSSANLAGVYNAYADAELSARCHNEAVEEVFEGIVAQGVFENSGNPFLAAANEQNHRLTEGKIFGWCASALQAAAGAFESALADGSSPSQAARKEFEQERSKTDWDTIKKLGDKIIEQRRFGYAVTFTDLLELCRQMPEFTPVRNSLENTIKDPSFQRKLEAAADLAAEPSLAPSSPHAAPKTAPRAAPGGPQFATPAPGLGGNGNGARMRHISMAQQAGKSGKSTDNSDEGDKA